MFNAVTRGERTVPTRTEPSDFKDCWNRDARARLSVVHEACRRDKHRSERDFSGVHGARTNTRNDAILAGPRRNGRLRRENSCGAPPEFWGLTREGAGKPYVSSRLARAANALTGTALDLADNSVLFARPTVAIDRGALAPGAVATRRRPPFTSILTSRITTVLSSLSDCCVPAGALASRHPRRTTRNLTGSI